MEGAVSIAPQIINLFGHPIPNTIITLILLTLFIFIGALLLQSSFGIIPTRLQVLFEEIYVFFYKQVHQVMGSVRRTRRFLPLILSIFIVLFITNQFSLIPLLGQITYGGEPLFRTPTSDASLPLALALSVIILSHILSFAISPLGHIGKFFNIQPLLKARSGKAIFDGIIELFLGILDIIGEFSKIFSLTFRLFGNIIAGEIIILVISGLALATSFIVPLPFMVLSIFSGLVQAFVFSVLSLQFIAGMLPPEEEVSETRDAAQEFSPILEQ